MIANWIEPTRERLAQLIDRRVFRIAMLRHLERAPCLDETDLKQSRLRAFQGR
jgi:hypothetical protein